jgi:O-antigen/teichoic acid export membrane protein
MSRRVGGGDQATEPPALQTTEAESTQPTEGFPLTEQVKMEEAVAGDSAEHLDRRVVRASGWVAASYGVRSILSMLSMLALVRMLDPKAFGLVSLATIAIAVIDQLQAAGITAALIYRRDEIRRAAASGLVFTTGASVFWYALLFAMSSLLESVFHTPGVQNVARVLGLVLLFRGLSAVPTAILERELDFRSLAKTELSAGVCQVTVSIALAFAGAGVWSLVAGQLAAEAIQVLLLWVLVPWRPRPWEASFRIMRELLRYGRSVTGGNVIGFLNGTVDNMLVARLLGAKLLGFYAVTFRLADFPTSVIGYVVGRVMLPAYTSVQDDAVAFRRAFVQNLQRVALLALPIGVGLAVGAGAIVRGLLGEQWMPVVTPLRILAVYSIVRSFASCAGPPFQALGKPHLVGLFALPQTLVAIPALILLIPRLGVTGAALAMLLGFACAGIPALVHAIRLLELGPRALGRALGPSLLSATLLAVALAGVIWVDPPLPPIGDLVLLAVVGILVYGAATMMFARDAVAPIVASFRASASATP